MKPPNIGINYLIWIKSDHPLVGWKKTSVWNSKSLFGLLNSLIAICLRQDFEIWYKPGDLHLDQFSIKAHHYKCYLGAKAQKRKLKKNILELFIVILKFKKFSLWKISKSSKKNASKRIVYMYFTFARTKNSSGCTLDWILYVYRDSIYK